MSKYIDAEKLIADIKRQQRNLVVLSNTEQVCVRRDCAIQNGVYSYILSVIISLQQEQQEFPTTDEEVKKALSTIPKAELPDKYKTPDCIWEDKTIDQLAEEYVEGVKKCNDMPNWDLIHTAVCYGYGLGKNTRKEE